MKKINLGYLIAMLLLMFGCSKNQLNKNQPNIPGDASIALPSAPGDVVGKVTVGYQGWFSAAGDGSPVNAWSHQNHETWPDVREYTTTYQSVQPNLGNGQPAKMFSSYDQSTVNIHLQWMQQNGIDCAALQRFGGELSNTNLKAQRDGMAGKVRTAAEATGRKFFIMYDISGWTAFQAGIKTDWTNTMINRLNITSSSAYAKQNGKPVVCIWGMGFNDSAHNFSAAVCLDVINWFKSQGCYVIGGVPNHWLVPDGGARTGFTATYQALDMIQPWTVGCFSGVTGANGHGPVYTDDLNFCNTNNIDYQPVAFPGTSFYNTNGTAQNLIPRLHGDFLWTQFAQMKTRGVQSAYIAMFDETNEATSIFKCAEDVSMIPAGKWYLTLDADGTHVSSDFYLRLVNDGGKMLKGQIPYTATVITPFVLPTGPANGTYKIINRNGGLAMDAKGQLTANGTPIQQYTYAATSNQKWTVTSLGSGKYKIIGVQSGRSLDVQGQSTANNAAIQLYDYNAGLNQQWILTPTTGGYYTIQGVQSGKLVEVTGSSTANSALVKQNAATGANNQQWAFQTP
jgi:hypothetical protein